MKSDMNVMEYYKNTPLINACEKNRDNSYEIIKYMIENNTTSNPVNLNAVTYTGLTLLHCACLCTSNENNNMQIIRYLAIR